MESLLERERERNKMRGSERASDFCFSELEKNEKGRGRGCLSFGGKMVGKIVLRKKKHNNDYTLSL